MATESTMLALATPAPSFDLPDTVAGGRQRTGLTFPSWYRTHPLVDTRSARSIAV